MLSLLSLVVDVELSSASQAFPDGIRWAFCSGPVVGTGLFLRRVFIYFCRHLFPLHCSDSSSYSAVLCLHISLSCLASHLSLLFVTPWYDIVVSSHRHQLFCCSSFSLSIIATIVLCPIAQMFLSTSPGVFLLLVYFGPGLFGFALGGLSLFCYLMYCLFGWRSQCIGWNSEAHRHTGDQTCCADVYFAVDRLSTNENHAKRHSHHFLVIFRRRGSSAHPSSFIRHIGIVAHVFTAPFRLASNRLGSLLANVHSLSRTGFIEPVAAGWCFRAESRGWRSVWTRSTCCC